MRAISDGLKRIAEVKPKTRGALTEDMVEKMIKLNFVTKEMKDALIVLSATGISPESTGRYETVDCQVSTQRSQTHQQVREGTEMES